MRVKLDAGTLPSLFSRSVCLRFESEYVRIFCMQNKGFKDITKQSNMNSILYEYSMYIYSPHNQ